LESGGIDNMAQIYGQCREVMDKTEWAAITSLGSDGPHTVATWGDHLMDTDSGDDEVIVIPAGKYNKTEQNLRENGRLELLIASKQVQGSYGVGQGCRISGEGGLQTTGRFADMARERFPWARGALVIKVKEVSPQL
jgi:predicted pyridoxine 5'-phosphate oxidase superfamily flavin-nucleotide-binding protein